ncbi:heat shock protein 60 [Tanacetum coccineum]|uniref:Heat shock protein 60 n=1 Tax=Tanacetum coccineum TaxID=301880 RepID=A0ABQ4ZH41_9ASTR
MTICCNRILKDRASVDLPSNLITLPWFEGIKGSTPYSHIANVRMQQVVEDDMVSARQVDRSLGTKDFNMFVIALVRRVHQMNTCKSLLIVSKDIESEAVAALILNNLRACWFVSLKLLDLERTDSQTCKTLQLLQRICGYFVITDELGMNLEKMSPEMLGTCKRITIPKDDTVILDGAGDKKGIGERCEQFRSLIELSTSNYDKEKLQDLLAKLFGGVAVLKMAEISNDLAAFTQP